MVLSNNLLEYYKLCKYWRSPTVEFLGDSRTITYIIGLPYHAEQIMSGRDHLTIHAILHGCCDHLTIQAIRMVQISYHQLLV